MKKQLMQNIAHSLEDAARKASFFTVEDNNAINNDSVLINELSIECDSLDLKYDVLSDYHNTLINASVAKGEAQEMMLESLSIENATLDRIVQSIKALWEEIKKVALNAWEIVSNFFKNIFTTVGRLKNKVSQQLRDVNRLKGDPKEKAVVVSKALASNVLNTSLSNQSTPVEISELIKVIETSYDSLGIHKGYYGSLSLFTANLTKLMKEKSITVEDVLRTTNIGRKGVLHISHADLAGAQRIRWNRQVIDVGLAKTISALGSTPKDIEKTMGYFTFEGDPKFKAKETTMATGDQKEIERLLKTTMEAVDMIVDSRRQADELVKGRKQMLDTVDRYVKEVNFNANLPYDKVVDGKVVDKPEAINKEAHMAVKLAIQLSRFDTTRTMRNINRYIFNLALNLSRLAELHMRQYEQYKPTGSDVGAV